MWMVTRCWYRVSNTADCGDDETEGAELSLQAAAVCLMNTVRASRWRRSWRLVWARTQADEHEVISHIVDRVFAAADLDAAVFRQLVREQFALYYPVP
jgi:hypothetical protein